ncbi:sodium-independent anion transporter [Marispirochaeta aestuarii]|uniref:Sodium-independent anion transporter n=1 Tax=Marispirochaeta aestuarii TaxID=1963862 RepID=A0A1Y1RTU9_9SPIO|nr:SulP family inorganic anion transporter [Marispirochaeta aestuarii]ORC31220.1 sodium-independent anion transporter [Marispirochaeta aestuarii]
MKHTEFTPKLFHVLKEGVPRQQLVRDISAGLIVGIVALPLAIAFAIASGVSPDRGILTAILAGLLISIFGGSRVQIGGPTGAFVVIVYGIIRQHGYEGLLIATLMAGIILVLMGLLRLGSLIKYIPQTLITGFTSGIAVLIFSSQIKDLLGLNLEEVPAEFIPRWGTYLGGLSTLNPWALVIGLFSIAAVVLVPRLLPKVPGAFVAIIVSTVLVSLFELPVETIAGRFGPLSPVFPPPVFPAFDPQIWSGLLLAAFSIALLGALESLLSAVVADGVIGGRHRSNIELIAQGLANIVSPLFGGIPATGAIARTMTSIKLGARTPIAGIVHALTLLVIFLVAMPLVSAIPMACLAGILVVVAWNMSEYRYFILSCRINIYETAVLLTTFFLTVFTDLTIAIPAGFVLALVLFMKRMSEAVDINPLVASKSGESLFSTDGEEIPEEVQVFEINGPLFFGSAGQFLNVHAYVQSHHSLVLFRMRYVPIMDSSGLRRFTEIVHALKKQGIRVLVSGANSRITEKLIKHGVLGRDAIFADFSAAVKKAKTLIE